jgi:hypothetical protein
VAEDTHGKAQSAASSSILFFGSASPRDLWVGAITPIPSNGFALATRLQFMLSGDVAFSEQNSPVLARATEILAQPGEELGLVEPGNPANGARSP